MRRPGGRAQKDRKFVWVGGGQRKRAKVVDASKNE